MNNPVVFNGKILPADQAFVSVFDPGFLYGESVFTTIAVIDHLPRFLPRHMDRLMMTAQKMGLRGLPEKGSVSEAIHLLLGKLPSPPALLRVTISPGTLSGYRLDGSKEGPCTWMVLPVFRSPLPDNLYKSGISAEIGPVISPGSADPRSVHKTGNILLQRWIRQKMDKDLFESLFRNARGLLLEGTICNLFWIMEDGLIMTPPESWGVLPGVVRAVVREIIGEKSLPFRWGSLTASSLPMARSAFLTNSYVGILPIRSIRTRHRTIQYDPSHPILTCLSEELHLRSLRESNP
jgi:branched-subunit amino acid aminotransferase/4-amino-4-deoxychorismate lyase|uniref:Branched-chain amino acid aminotransferase n=1 Tax=Leptospirillum ferriphilum TaxID=178606 RepID=A0A7C3R2X9_9BACT